jgi:hypothetical protein
MRAAFDPAGVYLNRHPGTLLPDVMGRLGSRPSKCGRFIVPGQSQPASFLARA